MIFIILGSQKFQFNRLLIAVDELAGNKVFTDEIFAQTGHSDYEPRNYQYKQFLDREEFAAITNQSDIVITHGGTGAIIGAVKLRKKVIVVPRLTKYGEHVDDHQLQLMEQFKDMNLIMSCVDTTQLGSLIEQIKNTKFNSYESNTKEIIQSIDTFLMEEQELR